MTTSIHHLERGSGAPLWRQISDAIGEDIVARELTPGSRLQTEPELASHFDVNRHTVRKALQHLAQRGIVRIAHGKGTFVQAHGIDYPLSPRTRFSEIMLAAGLTPAHDIVSISQAHADQETARLLKLRRGGKVLNIETTSSANGEVVSVSQHTFPLARLPGISELMEETYSVSEAMRRLGHDDYKRAWTRITAELPSRRIAGLLGRPPSRPVLITRSLNVSADDMPLELGTAHFAGDLCRVWVEGAET